MTHADVAAPPTVRSLDGFVHDLSFTDLPEAVELAAYFVVAEALTNVAKYAKASHATVEVARELTPEDIH